MSGVNFAADARSSGPRSRRAFLADVGRGVLVAAVGSALAADLGLAGQAAAGEADDTKNLPAASGLSFGPLEPLVRLMQETPADKLLPKLAEQLAAGTELRRLVAAAAMANARTFGGEDYVGFHTMMALAPALHMAGDLPADRRALPVFKVLYRNTSRIQEHGGRPSEVLHPVEPADLPDKTVGGEMLRDAVRRRDVDAAERIFAALSRGVKAGQVNVDADALGRLFNALLTAVEDATEVHRVVLPYRAWDLLDLVGREQAVVLLRQSVRYCVKNEAWAAKAPWDGPRTVLPKLLEDHKLIGAKPGERLADDKQLEELAKTMFAAASPTVAAEAAAAALADGLDPAAVGEAMSLAANQLILRDMGRTPRDEVVNKPIGSVHGDSIGVHACDSANAWRNLARVSRQTGSARNTFACLILGAYQVASDRTNRGGDFLNWQPLPLPNHVAQVKPTDAAGLLGEAEEAIRGNLQAHAAAVIHRYGELGHDPGPAFDLMLKYAVSEDGSLHAEKFYRTTSEEFAATRPAFRWRQLTALARVTASEFGRTAPGYAQARELLKV